MPTLQKSRFERLKSWWHAPATPKDRVLGAVVGAFAGFWVGILSVAALAPSGLQPISFVALVMAGCVIAGVLFPKVATVVLFPFGLIGGGA